MAATAHEEDESGERRWRVIARVESSRRLPVLIRVRQPPRHVDSALFRQVENKDTIAPIRHNDLMLKDEIIRRIESFPFRRAPVAAERRNRGYTLLHAETGAPIARLRPVGPDDQMEILYWSSWKQHWAPVGPFGRTVAPIDEALRIIAFEPIFWAGL